jgi:hypothetical protein
MPTYSRAWSFALIVLLALLDAVSAFCPLVLVSHAARVHKRAYTLTDMHAYMHTYLGKALMGSIGIVSWRYVVMDAGLWSTLRT